MFKKLVLLLLVLLFIVCVSGIGSYFWYQQQLAPVSKSSDSQKIAFVITQNESAAQVLDDLYTKSLIRSPLAAKVYLKLNQLANKLRPGGYVLTANLSTPDIFRTFISGPIDVWVTIPEGWRREQIAARIDSTLTGPSKTFDPAEFIIQTATLEGYLFPDKYLIPQHISTADAVALLTRTFSAKTHLTSSPEDRATLILASLVEREAKTSSERQQIASILKKRLLDDWPLQVDATVQFATDSRLCSSNPDNCSWWRNPIDTKFLSSYNSYLHPGLPPGPICNPGLAAISAVQNAVSTPYWYYLAGNDGVTYYASTLKAHNENIDKYLK